MVGAQRLCHVGGAEGEAAEDKAVEAEPAKCMAELTSAYNKHWLVILNDRWQMSTQQQPEPKVLPLAQRLKFHPPPTPIMVQLRRQPDRCPEPACVPARRQGRHLCCRMPASGRWDELQGKAVLGWFG